MHILQTSGAAKVCGGIKSDPDLPTNDFDRPVPIWRPVFPVDP